MIERDGPGAVTLGTDDRAAATAAVKALLRLTSDEETALLTGFAETALGLAEQFLGCVAIARTLADTLPASRAWQRLAAAPVRMIAGLDLPDGTPLAPDAFALDIDADGDGWVRVCGPVAATRVTVRFEAGIADDWSGLPAPVRQGAVLLAAHLFDVRDGGTPPPAAVAALWRPFRRIALGARRAAVASC